MHFCTFNRQEIIAFVFNMLDSDHDKHISKTEIFRFLMQYRHGFRVYPNNVTRAIELAQVKRGDRIDFIEFAEIVNSFCSFLVFPAFRLQSIMRERFGGFALWNYVIKKLKLR